MQVRLAFSVMLEADADVLLIDEVLAVGDAAFQQKCADAFHAMKAAGKTIVLVTHEMTSVEEYCHRAMLIDDGKILHIGEPGEVGRHYLQLNFERGSPEDYATVTSQPGDEVNLIDIWLENMAGEPITNVEHGASFRLCAELEALQEMAGLGSASASPTPTGSPSQSSASYRKRTAADPARAGRASDGSSRDREPAGGRPLLRPSRGQSAGRCRRRPLHQQRSGLRGVRRRGRRHRLASPRDRGKHRRRRARWESAVSAQPRQRPRSGPARGRRSFGARGRTPPLL